MNNEISRLSLSLSLCEHIHKRGGQAGLISLATPRLPKGGLRRSDYCQMLIDLRGDSRG